MHQVLLVYKQIEMLFDENGELYISQIFVDEAHTLYRMRPAPQGRGYRIRKRSNHVTIYVDTKVNNDNKKVEGNGTEG